MPFVKLDCAMLNSTIWCDREARELFLTALMMAEPREYTEPVPQIEVDSLGLTGWAAPPGWYGLVAAAGSGIIRRAGFTDTNAGTEALKRLGAPEADSRSPDFEGRRLVRVDGGYIVLNFQKYRDRDYGAAARMKRWRASQKDLTQAQRPSSASPTPASAPPGFNEWWAAYPRKVGKGAALKAWRLLTAPEREAALMASPAFAEAWRGSTADRMRFCPHPTTFLNQRRYTDDPAEWQRQAGPDAPAPFVKPQRSAFPPSAKALEAAELDAEADQAKRNREAHTRYHAQEDEDAELLAKRQEEEWGAK